jgi:hypothetical protein
MDLELRHGMDSLLGEGLNPTFTLKHHIHLYFLTLSPSSRLVSSRPCIEPVRHPPPISTQTAHVYPPTPPKMSEPPQTPDIGNPPVAASAEDRKAASALAALDSTTLEDTTSPTSPSAGGANDAAAVRDAMARLEGKSLTKPTAAAQGGKAGVTVPVVSKAVKVDQADVALLVDQLELSKPKATELLKTHGGDAVKALRAYVTTPW